MDISRVRKELENSVFGSKIVYYEVTDSTNIRAKELASEGAPHGTVIIADEQQAGKGRLNRKWVSPRGDNLMFSVVLRPNGEPDQVFFLTMLLALSVRKVLKNLLNLTALMKWPNDIYVSGKKAGGILTEFSVCRNQVDYVIIGMGLNVNWHPGRDSAILYPCTSLMQETGVRVERSLILIDALLQFEKYYQEGILGYGSAKTFKEEWNACSYVLGKKVVVSNGLEKVVGKAMEIEASGALIIKNELGHEERILWGDVSVESIEP